MKYEQLIYRFILLLLILIAGGFIEGLLVDYGLVNPVVGGISLPVITAAVLFVLFWIVEKKAKQDIV